MPGVRARQSWLGAQVSVLGVAEQGVSELEQELTQSSE